MHDFVPKEKSETLYQLMSTRTAESFHQVSNTGHETWNPVMTVLTNSTSLQFLPPASAPRNQLLRPLKNFQFLMVEHLSGQALRVMNAELLTSYA